MQYARNHLEIDIEAILRNLDAIANRSGQRAVMAVIKANAYGHGAVPLARAIEAQIQYFGVATAEEAYTLREAGITKPILLLGCADSSQYSTLISHQITLTVFRASDAEALSNAAAALGMTATAHIAVDTGMSRIGLLPDEAGIDEAEHICACEHVKVEGIFSHLSCADEEDRDFTHTQIETFCAFLRRLAAKGLTFSYRHLHNSAGIIGFEIPECNMVRAGIAMYGIYPSDIVNKRAMMLFPAMSWHTGISYLKRLPAGTPISYGATFVTARETVVATLPVGYADGYPRTLSGKGEVLIRGKRAPILGRICMDQMMVDVTEIPGVVEGDRVTLMGCNGSDAITLEELAARSGRFFYELPCLVTDRVPRIYVNQPQYEI